MAKLTKTIPVPGKSADEIFAAAKTAVNRLLEKASLPGAEITPNEAEKKFTVKSKWISGDVKCEQNAVTVDANISFLALPLQGQITSKLEHWVQKLFDRTA